MLYKPAAAMAIAALLSGCHFTSAAATSAGGPLPSGAWVARLAPTLSSLGVKGDLRLIPTAKDGEMRAEFDMRAVEDRGRYPWVIRTGTCGETTTREITSRAAPVLVGGPDQVAILKVTIPLRLVPGDAYHVIVVSDPQHPDDIVACGPLIFVP